MYREWRVSAATPNVIKIAFFAMVRQVKRQIMNR
jgi:hypothetical protein